MNIKDNNKEYQCHYGHRFLGKQTKLVAFRNESRDLLGKTLFVTSEESDFLRGGRPLEGYFLACPTCGIIQLGGFVCPTDKAIDPASVHASVEKRNVTLAL
jgi:hypothetical protein